MNDDQTSRVEALFVEVSERTPDEREDLLTRVSRDDPAVAAEVRSLLAFDHPDEAFLRSPIVRPEADEDADTSREPVSSPTHIGRYRILNTIGTGGMAVVYEAEQDHPRRTVALKVMRQGMASRSAARRFAHESQILARLHHPGIAQVYDVGVHDGGVPYFVMEYIQGARTIIDYADDTGLGVRQRLELFITICDAVQHGHQKGIIHRDLKPGNILVDSSGQTKVIDFGVARVTDSDIVATTMQTDVGQLIGTLQYMSPEQFEADPHDLDVRSDVYALGVVLYELLSGRVPYDLSGVRIDEAARVVREDAPTRPSLIDRALRGDLETIVLTALEKDRQRRYQSVADLSADIQRSLTSQPIAARPASAIYQLKTFAKRNKTLVGGAAATFAVLLLGVIGTSVGLMGALTAQAEASQRADRLAELVAFQESQLTHLDTALMLIVGPGVKERALVHVRTVVEEREQVLGPRNPATISAMLILGRRLGGLDHHVEAEQVFDRAMFNARGVLAEDDLLMVLLLQSRGTALRKLGRLEEAARLGKESVRLFHLHHAGRDGEWIPWTPLYTYGHTLIELERFGEAEPVLLESYLVREAMVGSTPGPGSPSRLLARLYAAWHEKEPDAGHDVEAAEWRATLTTTNRTPP